MAMVVVMKNTETNLDSAAKAKAVMEAVETFRKILGLSVLAAKTGNATVLAATTTTTPTARNSEDLKH